MVERPKLHLDRRLPGKSTSMTSTAHPKVPPHEAENFIYAKTDAHKRWVPIFIGQADLTQRAAMEGIIRSAAGR